jgi:hypothetical protein
LCDDGKSPAGLAGTGCLDRGVQLGPMCRREGHVGEHVWLRVIEEAGELGQLGPYLVGNSVPLGSGRLGIVLGEGGGDEGGDDAPAATTAPNEASSASR